MAALERYRDVFKRVTDNVTGHRTPEQLKELRLNRHRPPLQRGFTLLEVLVVVLIIGIVISLATLAIRDDPVQRARTEVERLGALLTLASQEAVLQSREVAVEFEPKGYHFLFLKDGNWEAPNDNLFRARQLPPDMELHITIEGQDINFERDNQREPRIYLLSGGEMTPFELTIANLSGTASYRVRADFGGKLAFSG